MATDNRESEKPAASRLTSDAGRDGDVVSEGAADASEPLRAESGEIAPTEAGSEPIAHADLNDTGGTVSEIGSEQQGDAVDEADAVDAVTKTAAEGGASAVLPAEARETGPGATAAEAPSFDIVRVERDGSAVAAGRAQPGESVEILVDDVVVGRTTAGVDGAFVAFFDTAPGSEAQRIIARTVTEDMPPKDDGEAVYIVPPAVPGEVPLVAQTSVDGVQVLQPSARSDASEVTLDAISYDSAGRVVFAGRAQAGSEVRVYLDNVLIAETRLGADSAWTSRTSEAVGIGSYTVRVDEIGPLGEVQSRIETPFLREAIAEARSAPRSQAVKKGDSLWRIAEAHYGSGMRYTLIFAANAGAIRDPDLIYPGQIVTLPTLSPAE